MSVFSGLLPVVNLGNSYINQFVQTAGTTLFETGVSIALNKALGDSIKSALGISLNAPTSLLEPLITQGVPAIGVNAVSQAIGNTLLSSRALGGFAPFASSVVQPLVSTLGNQAVNSLVGKLTGASNPSGNNTGSIYFPGAGGTGEGDANYSGSVYTGGKGGPDVVFSILPSVTSAKRDITTSYFSTGSNNLAGANAYNLNQQSSNNPVNSAAQTSVAAAAAQTVNPNAPLNSQQSAQATQTATTSGASTEGQSKYGSPGYFSEIASKLNSVRLPSFASLTKVDLISNYGAIDSGAMDLFNGKNPFRDNVWNFICPPEDISWETTAQVDRVNIFGANQAPVTAGVKGMRDLSLNNAVVEGFTRSKTVEDKIIALEELMNMSFSPDGQYIQVPVYKITAQVKKYGQGVSDKGFFIIKSIKVQEKMRDLSGNTTRATVDISFTQVPPYQVNDGRDIASKFLSSRTSPLDDVFKKLKEVAKENALKAAAASAASAASAAKNQGTEQGGNTPAAQPRQVGTPNSNPILTPRTP